MTKFDKGCRVSSYICDQLITGTIEEVVKIKLIAEEVIYLISLDEPIENILNHSKQYFLEVPEHKLTLIVDK